MIFRRRRTRIEIEHTTVRVEGGALFPVTAATSSASPAESVLGRVLPPPSLPAAELNATLSAMPTAIAPAKETRS